VFKFRLLPIGRQIFIFTLVLCVLVFGALIAGANLNVENSASATAEKDLRAQLKVVSDLMEYAYRQGTNRALRDGHQFMKSLPGPVTVEDKTMTTGAAELPIVRIDGNILNGDPTLLQKYSDSVGSDPALLVRHNGELYRLATLLKDANGKSAVGTVVPKGDPIELAYDGGVEKAVMIVRGGRYYSVLLTPVKDPQGKMIAALTTRVDLTGDMNDFMKILQSVVIGKTGYLFAFRPSAGEDGGVFTVHPKLEGKTLKDAFGGDAASFAQIKEVGRARGGAFHPMWPDPSDGGKLKEKFVIALNVPSWGWVLAGGTFVEEFMDDARSLRNLLIAQSVVAAVLMMGLIYVLIMLSLKRIKPVLAAMQRQGTGDLTVRVEGVAKNSANELDVLAQRFNQSSDEIQGLVSNLAGAAHRIGNSSDQLERAAGEIAKSTSQQSEAASSMAASVEELTVSISHVADSAGEASVSTQAAKQASTEGSMAIKHSIVEMQRIAEGINSTAAQVNQLGERSRQISGIIKVISEIAGQTNLLALNAAIEAARAGEQGKGFAVVADEVRKLSERTGASAQEISQMIGAIQADTAQAVERMNVVAREVAGGVELVQNVGVSLDKIDARTRDTTTLAGQIATAVTEQKVASEDIAKRLESIAQSAEQNAALTGNNREVALDLRKCAEELKGQIGRFRIEA